jgi:hypothetical protein
MVNSSGTNVVAFEMGRGGSRSTLLYDTTTATEFGTLTSKPLKLLTNGAVVATLDTSGNLGLGVTPSAWNTYKVLEIGTVGNSISGGVSSTLLNLTNNAYYNSGWKYANNTTGASLFQTSGGASYWYINNTSGTAGNAITFTQAMTLDASGNLGIGTSSLNISSGSSGSQVITISASASGRNALLELKGTRTSADQVSSYIRSFSNSATSPGVDFQFYRGATDTDGFLTISTSGTERMRIDSAGRIGFGTGGSVADRLINANFAGVTTTGGTQFGFLFNPTYPNTATANIYHTYFYPNLTAGTTLTNLYNLYLEANNITGSTVANSYGVYQAGTNDKNYFAGNVGIGATSPAYNLTTSDNAQIGSNSIVPLLILGKVVPTGGGDAAIQFRHSNNTKNWSISSNKYTSSGLEFTPSTTDGGTTFTTPAMVLDTSGNLGLPVVPSSWQTALGSRAIQFTGSAVYGYRDTNILLTQNAYLDTSGVWKYYASSIATAYSDIGSGAFGWFQAASGTANNTVTFTKAMTLDASGNLLVARPSQTNGGRLEITGNGSDTVGLFHQTGTGSLYQIIFSNPNGNVGSIQTSGSSTSYVTSSDYRLKNTIAPMTGALAKVAQLKPVTYKWKVDGSDGQGFIAHELQAVVPECVTGEKDAVDKDGKPVYQQMDTSFLVATLTKAIQEQQALIESLTTTVNSQAQLISSIQEKLGS